MMIIVKKKNQKKTKKTINVKFRVINHIFWHPLKKKSLDNILLDAYKYISSRIMVKNTFEFFWLLYTTPVSGQ